MSYNYQDAPRESQQEYFGKFHTDNKETLYNALKRIEELEKENVNLKSIAEFQQSSNMKRYFEIQKLKKENTGLKKKLKEKLKTIADKDLSFVAKFDALESENAELKDLIKNIIRVTWGEGWNYSLDWKVKAEQFLKEIEK